ncbi:MAG: hypothetical protein H6Q89_1384, partial [Myxococcaceae bacterium]|nr:hypothetical protein [Myxococcaceae bacterium]
MRNPSLVKLLFGVAVVSLAACQCGPPEPALQVLITIDPTVPATCVVLEVSSGGTVRLSQELKRPAGKNAYRVGIKKLQLPNELQLVARSYSSTSGAGCGEPRFQTSASAPVDAAFPKSDVATFTVEIHPPGPALDADADGHLDLAKGGDDCNDQDNAIHPGLAAACGSVLDNDCDGKIGCADSECATATICNQPPAGLAFVTTAAPVSVNACSPALTIEVRDANNTPALVAVDTGVALGVIPAGGVLLYSDAACLTAVTQVTVPLGQSRASFHFKAAAAGSFEATATVLGLPTATQTQTVIQATVAQVAFTNPPLTVATGACSGQLTLQTRDGNGNAAPVPAAASIALSSNQAGVAFFSDPACATALLNSALPIAAGASGGSFYVRASSIQPTTLTATLAALPPVSQALTVTAGAPTQLAFATPAQGIGSGVCSTVVTVETRDPANNLSPVAAATTVTLNATGVAIGLFSDSNCTVPITAPLALAAGGSSVSFHFSGTVVGMVTISADATGLTQATQLESIGVGAPAKLVLSAAQAITAGQCSAAATVGTQDANSNPSNVTGAPLPVTLGGPATGFAFFSDSGCATAVTGPLSIPVGSASATFYFRGTAAGAQNITATAASLAPAMATHTINPAAPSVLAFTSPVQSQVAGTCAQFDLEARDAFGNPSAPSAAQTVTLASTPAITFSAAAGCAASATSVSLVGTTVSFFGRGTVAGAKALTPTAPFGAAAQTYTVTPGAAAQLGFTVQPTSAIAGAALAPAVEVAIQDSFGNTVPAATANVTVAIGTNPGTGVLSGTLTVAAVAGVASFSTLAIDKTGLGYTLGATSGSLTAATSAAFDIAAGAPAGACARGAGRGARRAGQPGHRLDRQRHRRDRHQPGHRRARRDPHRRGGGGGGDLLRPGDQPHRHRLHSRRQLGDADRGDQRQLRHHRRPRGPAGVLRPADCRGGGSGDRARGAGRGAGCAGQPGHHLDRQRHRRDRHQPRHRSALGHPHRRGGGRGGELLQPVDQQD